MNNRLCMYRFLYVITNVHAFQAVIRQKYIDRIDHNMNATIGFVMVDYDS